MTREQAISAIANANRKRTSYCGIVSYEADAEVFVDNLIAIGLFNYNNLQLARANDPTRDAKEAFRLNPDNRQQKGY